MNSNIRKLTRDGKFSVSFTTAKLTRHLLLGETEKKLLLLLLLFFLYPSSKDPGN